MSRIGTAGLRTQRVPQLDRGYAWIVAFACFTSSFIMAGLARAAGVLYVAVIELYGVSREAATTPFSVRFSVRSMSGPLVGILAQRYGIRAITTAGGVLAGIGGALCVFAPDVFWLTVLWGGVHGIGYGLCNLIHVMILNQYFDKYKATALGLALSGDCVGTFAFPIILELLLQNYGVNGTFLILGGIALNVVPAGLLMKTPDWLLVDADKNTSECSTVLNIKASKPYLSGVINKAFNLDYLSNGDAFSKTYNKHAYLTSYSQVKDSDILHILNSNKSVSKDTFGMDNLTSDKNRSNSQLSFSKPQDATVPNSAKLEETTASFKEVPSGETTSSYVFETLTGQFLLGETAERNILIAEALKSEKFLSNVSDNDPEVSGAVESQDNPIILGIYPEKIQCDAVVTSNELHDHKVRSSAFVEFFITNTRPLFILIAITLSVYQFLFIAVITIIIDYATDVGVSADDAKYLVIGFSVADLIGRIGFGGVLDKKWIKYSHFAGLTTALIGISVMAIPINSNPYYIMACMVFSGFVQGGNTIMYAILVEQYMDKKEQSLALGCLNFYGGLLILLLSPMIGFFRDTIGSYEGVFLTNGGLCVMAGILWIFEPYLWRMQQKMSKNNIT